MNLSGENLNSVEQKDLNNALKLFDKVFSDVPAHTTVTEHQIVTTSDTPVVYDPYRLCPQWREPVRKEVETILALGIINQVTVLGHHPLYPSRSQMGICVCVLTFENLMPKLVLSHFTCP